MRDLINFQKKTVFSRILIFNILIVLIISAVYQAIYFKYFKEKYDSEINSSSMQIVSQFQKNIDENILNKVINIPGTYFVELQSNRELTLPLTEDISGDPIKILNICSRLDDIKKMLPFIDSIDVYYTKGDILLIDSKYYTLKNLYSEESNVVDWLDIMKTTDNSVAWLPTRHTDRPVTKDVLTYVKTIPYFSPQDKRQAIIAVNINEATLYSALTEYKQNKNGELLIIDSKGNVIAHSNRTMLFKNVSTLDFARKLLGTSSPELFKMTINGELSVVTSQKSAYNDWTYIYITSVNDFYKKSLELKRLLIILGVMLLALNILISAYLTKKAYRPLGQIIKNISGIARSMNSLDNDEYKLLNNTVNNLLYKVDELNSRLEVNKPIIRHNIILKLLNSSMSMPPDNNELLDIQFNKDMFFCFIIKIYPDEELSFESKMLILYNLIENLENNNADMDIRAITEENNTIAGIVNYDSHEVIDKVLEEMCKIVEGLLNARYSLSTGKAYTITTELFSTSYREARESLTYSFVKPDSKLLEYAALKMEERTQNGDFFKILDKIQGFIRSGDETNLTAVIDEVMDVLSNGMYKIDFCKNTLMDIVSIIRISVKSLGYSSSELFGCDIREHFKAINSIKDFQRWIHNIIHLCCSAINDKRTTFNKDLDIEKLKIYIESNLYNDISLTAAAEHMFISPNYLSKLFRELQGITFQEYVTEQKLLNASALLKENKLSVKEISQKLGYNSTQHFITIFKQRFGSTPKEYQKKNLEVCS